MADNKNGRPTAQQGQPLKKADVIIQNGRQLSAKSDELLNVTKATQTSMEGLLEQLAAEKQRLEELVSRSEALQGTLGEEFVSLKRELRYLSMQNASIFESVSQKIETVCETAENEKAEPAAELGQAEETAPVTYEIDYDLLAEKVAARIPAPVAETATETVAQEIDYDLLVDKLVERLPAPTATEAVAQEIDYDILAEKLAERLPAQTAEAPVVASAPEIDYDLLAEKVAERVPAPVQEIAAASAAPVVVASNESVEIDYQELADKVISRIPVQESVSPDYIASRVAEQLVVPQVASEVTFDIDELAEKVAEKLNLNDTKIDIDSESIAEKVAEKINATGFDNEYIAEKVAERVNLGGVDSDYIASKVAESIVLPEQPDAVDYDLLAEKVAQKVVLPESRNTAMFAAAPAQVEYNVNEDELADAIALKVGSLKAEDFEILVDDEGCDSLSKVISEKLDYEYIANAVAEKLRETLVDGGDEPDYEEMANRISEKITVAGINEDAIADKAAAVLSNYLPEFDADEVADKVAEQVISAMPAVDHDVLTENISAKLIESQQDNDYEIVLDEDGIDRVSDSVSEKVYSSEDERFTAIENELAEIKEMLKNGVVAVAPQSDEMATSVYEEQYTVEETPLVTVSDLIDENYSEETVEQVEETAEENPEAEEIIEEIALPQEDATEEVVEEPVAEPVEEAAEEVTEEKSEPVIIAVEINSDGEETDDDNDADGEEESEESAGGVDFANMMRYNRSFIARIIQSTDDQKRYYGQVRNALLSYRKVNSNIAWGAERFHKGRETIARFKIRGKTLVVYLALDPATHEISVYHHKDVSSNKSLHGTPMMIKVKSPLGVKKAVRLIDEMLAARDGVKRNVPERDYAAMYPYETIEELIEDGLVKDVNKD